MAETMEKKSETSNPNAVAPFAVECDEPRNRDCIVQAIPGCKLRSAISAAKPVIDQKTGMSMIPPDQSASLGQFPPIPGMQLHINPAKLSYVVIDPLDEDEDLCARIKKAMDRTSPFRTEAKLKGVPPLKGTLDVHRMKTLVREMLWMLDSGMVKIIKGVRPNEEDVDKLPGKYLLNPGSRIPNYQPTFSEDLEEWTNQLTRSGG